MDSGYFLIREMRKLLPGHDAHDAALCVHVSPVAGHAGFQQRTELWQRVGLDDGQRRGVENLFWRLVMAVDATDHVSEPLPGRRGWRCDGGRRGWCVCSAG